ncbi:hypothetical protein [Tenacibaculum halocynthiae]|uniref:hypothetical protein n=1 Tax=Tenacibaculum halocynthiae TaxID=1254437 RepID=UPI0038942272
MKRIGLLIVIFCVSCSSVDEPTKSGEQGQFIDDWTYEFFMGKPDENAFKLWVPEGVTPKAILVLAPGGGNNGTGLVNSKEWQVYAKAEKLALLGVYVRSDLELASSNMIKALDKISIKNKISYVSNLPVLLRGFSHGGRFSYTFAQIYSTRTVAYVNIKGSIGNYSTNSPPGLLITGEKDVKERNETVKKAFLIHREKKSIVCFAEEPNIGHSVGDSDVLARSFFSSVMKQRLKNNQLQEIKEENTFLGDNINYSFFEYSSFPSDKKKASCLVDSQFANAWKDFIN